ncbi:4-hydroxy-3-methylbut-2-enyl diphosphate reductase [Patescibacteria group bacterium]|nr:4-hydroxy-3-methylbut-2-enyl diphosphate reductase [Patescibacteria group bacterium]
MVKKIILVKPRGLCAGVDRALRILEMVVKENKQPVYCRHEIVHNKKVVEEFKQKGVRFVEDLNQVPDGAVVVFSAHGSSPELFELAGKKNLTVIDAVCPLVTKVHNEAKNYTTKGYFVVYLGHKNHPEALGVLGEVKGNSVLISNLSEAKKLKIPQKAVLLTQTTLALDETKEIIDYLITKWPNLELPPGKDICFSTTNRQLAVKELAKHSDLILVVGSKISSNSNRLREAAGIEAYLVDGPEDLKEEWFENKETVGITAGASVPERLVDAVVKAVRLRFGGEIEEMEVIKERVKFKL